jgi:Enoyl-CoA hydratase/isomerase
MIVGSRSLQRSGRRVFEASSTISRALSATARQYQYFDNVEIKDGVAVVRLNGPGKMNTISGELQVETEKLFKENIIGNKDVKAVVFISSKPDNFIAGADIDMIKATQDKSTLKEVCAKGHHLFDELKKVRSASDNLVVLIFIA